MLAKFPSISQFSDFIKDARRFHKVYDEEGEKYHNATVVVQGTVKIHGTNAAIGYSNALGVWAQSHKRLLTPESDNFDFARYVDTHKDEFTHLLQKLARAFDVDLDKAAIYVYGEYCGGNIQKGVAVSGLPKMFVLFDAGTIAKVDDTMRWFDIVGDEWHIESIRCFNIGKFGVFTLETRLDPDSLAVTRTTLLKLTEQVEQECPVGRYFGRVRGVNCTVGEGIVWRGRLQKSYVANGEVVHKTHLVRWKVKGKLHANVTKAAALSPEVCASLAEFVEKAVTVARCEQGVQNVYGEESMSSEWFKKKRHFSNWILTDVLKEDLYSVPETLIQDGQVAKELKDAVRQRAEDWLAVKIEME